VLVGSLHCAFSPHCIAFLELHHSAVRTTTTTTTTITVLWLSGVSWYQKGKTKTNLDFLEQETVSGSAISWAICKSAPRPRQITMPAPHHSFFTGGMPFLPPNQQHQSTEGNSAVRMGLSAHSCDKQCCRYAKLAM